MELSASARGLGPCSRIGARSKRRLSLSLSIHSRNNPQFSLSFARSLGSKQTLDLHHPTLKCGKFSGGGGVVDDDDDDVDVEDNNNINTLQ
jgi:hypothetical protein